MSILVVAIKKKKLFSHGLFVFVLIISIQTVFI